VSADELGVWLRAERVGILRRIDGRRLSFQYDADHLSWDEAVPLSLSLPLRESSFDDTQARPFFANLLPDGMLREAVARKLGLSPANDFALLAALGGECAGAVSLLPRDAEPERGGEYVPLSEEDFAQIVEELPRRPLLAGERERHGKAGDEGRRRRAAAADSAPPLGAIRRSSDDRAEAGARYGRPDGRVASGCGRCARCRTGSRARPGASGGPDPALDPSPLPPGRAGDGSAGDGDLEREVRLERGTVVVPVPPPERHSRSSRPCHTRAMTTQSGSIR